MLMCCSESLGARLRQCLPYVSLQRAQCIAMMPARYTTQRNCNSWSLQHDRYPLVGCVNTPMFVRTLFSLIPVQTYVGVCFDMPYN